MSTAPVITINVALRTAMRPPPSKRRFQRGNLLTALSGRASRRVLLLVAQRRSSCRAVQREDVKRDLPSDSEAQVSFTATKEESMYAGIVRFTDVDPGRVAERQAAAEEMEGPPEGVPATGIQVFHDPDQRTAVVVQHFATEEDMKAGEAVLDRGPGGGRDRRRRCGHGRRLDPVTAPAGRRPGRRDRSSTRGGRMSTNAAIRRRGTRPRANLGPSLLDRPIADVGDSGSVDGIDLLEPWRLRTQVLEQPLAGAEEDRDQGDVEFVDQPGDQVLLKQVGPAGQGDVLVPGRVLGLLQRRLDPIGDEVKGRTALHLERLAGMVSEHEDRGVEGRILAPEPSPRVVAPRARTTTEHVAPHHHRPEIRRGAPLYDGRAGVDLASHLAVALAPRGQGEDPFMKLKSPGPERVLGALIRAGDEAVQ
jgi:hypothetical protein